MSRTAQISLSLCAFAAALTFGTAAAPAQPLPYLSDPVYEKLAAEDPHPMEDLLVLGEEGDVRAQFILGDLYGKGKGGLPRNLRKSREWFEKSARGGYAQSFIRLAALEKRAKKPEDAYKWYTLAIESLPASERRWAQRARDALVKEHNLSAAQTRAARQAAQAWKKPPVEKEPPAAATGGEKTQDTEKAGKRSGAADLTGAPEDIEPAAGAPENGTDDDAPANGAAPHPPSNKENSDNGQDQG